MDDRPKVRVEERALLVKWDGEPPPAGEFGEPVEVWEHTASTGWVRLYERVEGVPALRVKAFDNGRTNTCL